MYGFVAVLDQFCIGANLGVITFDEFEKAKDTALVHPAKSEGRGCFEKALLSVSVEGDDCLFRVLLPGLLDLPDVEVD